MAREKKNSTTGKAPVNKNKNGTSASTHKKWTNRERIILRRRKRETGDKIDDVASWFHLTYGKVIKSSTLCDFLGDKYEWLDSVDPNNPPEKRYDPHWPMLDKILVAWSLYQLGRGEKVTIPAMLKAGKEIWALLPPEGQFNVHYKKIMQPGWTTGFAQRLQNRYNLAPMAKQKEFHPSPVSPLDAIKDTRAIVDRYAPENVYSMDECGLFWKRGVSRSSAQGNNQLQTQAARIALTLCCNANGSDRLPIQFIGRSEMPFSFGFAENNTKEWAWTSNKCAWMTPESMVEWLNMFYMHIGRREVLLLISSAAVHKCAVMQNPPPSNIRISFLPHSLANAIQPLRQGIVKKVKHCFLKRLLQAKLEASEFLTLARIMGVRVPETPFTLTVKNAIWWLHSAWKNEVPDATIRKSWVRSSLIEDTQLQQVWVEESSKELSELFASVVQSGRISDPVCAEAFIHPHGEDDQPFSERPTIEDLVYWHLPVAPEDRFREDSQQVEFTPQMLQYYAQSVVDLRFFLESTCQLTEELKSSLGVTLVIISNKLRQVSHPPGTEIMVNSCVPATGKEDEEDSVRGTVVTVDSESSISEEESEG